MQKGRLDAEDVVLAYSAHIQLIGSKWKDELDRYFREGRYSPFLKLCEQVNSISELKTFKTELEEGWVPAQRAFWESEAALHPLAKSEDDKPLSPDA